MDNSKRPLILLTGATGYIGGRLLERFREAGYQVRCLARRPDYLAPRVGREVEVVKGDVHRGRRHPEQLRP